MSDANAQEPTMEEILASIRRIISEDDAPAADAAPAEAAAEAVEFEAEPEAFAAPPAPAAEPEAEDDDILELTDVIATPPSRAPAEALGDLDVFTREEPAAAPAPAPKPAFAGYEADEEPEDSLVSAPAADRASSYFGNLSRSLSMPSEGRTLEDLISELVRPLLKEWLDAHLPSIVEAKVQAEVERLSRSRR